MPDLLNAALRDQDANIRELATVAIEQMEAVSGETVDFFVTALQDKEVRSLAASALGKYGEKAKEAAPHLIEVLQEEDTQFRLAVASALGRMGPSAVDAVPVLIKLLRDQKAGRRAAFALSQVGPSAMPDLIGCYGKRTRRLSLLPCLPWDRWVRHLSMSRRRWSVCLNTTIRKFARPLS